MFASLPGGQSCNTPDKVSQLNVPFHILSLYALETFIGTFSTVATDKVLTIS